MKKLGRWRASPVSTSLNGLMPTLSAAAGGPLRRPTLLSRPCTPVSRHRFPSQLSALSRLRRPLYLPHPMRILSVLAVALCALAVAPMPHYRIYVASESGDIITQLTWDGAAVRSVQAGRVGILAACIDGP